MKLSLHHAAQWLDLALPAAPDLPLSAVGTDSRQIVPGQLFVALRGERFDGHDYVHQALASGAAAALVASDWPGSQDASLPLLVVPDTLQALGRLAAAWRGAFELPLIGVTGSNGKTSTKEMIAAILRAWARENGWDAQQAVLATEGNLNNDIGVPLMLLRLNADHRAAVIEMGMNHPGEIAYLAAMTRPTVALVTNAQRAHLEGMGSVLDVAREKGQIYGGLGERGIAVINADDPQAALWRQLNAGRQMLSFGLAAGADVGAEVRGDGLRQQLLLRTPVGAAAVNLAVPGLHNARNALAAAAACLAAGVPLSAVVAGLESYAGTPGRLQLRQGPYGCTVLDDSYNANPDSVRAGIDVLVSTPGRKILVLGDMGEIGETSAQLHDEVGGYAKSKGVDALFALGEMSEIAAKNFGEGGRHFARIEDLLAALQKRLDANTVVLVKGSRFMRMERISNALAEAGKPSGTL